LTSGRRPVVKIIAESLSQHDEKHVVPTPLRGDKGRRKKNKANTFSQKNIRFGLFVYGSKNNILFFFVVDRSTVNSMLDYTKLQLQHCKLQL
jgi:hypothetical protein